jgi:Mrr restriction endonuclease-like protein
VDTVLDDTERRELRRKARTATLSALHALGGGARREAIREQALGAEEFTARELEATASERSGGRTVRLVDQQLSWVLSDLKREGLVENPERGLWRLTAVARRLHELKRMPYPDYLNTPEWEQTRTLALERAEHRCAIDLTHSEGLDVLHRTRERLGSERPADLVVLCGSCLEHHQPVAESPPAPRVGSIPPPGPRVGPPEDATPEDPVVDELAARRPRLLRRLLAG